MDFKKKQLIPCEAPSWARGGHLQTIVSHYLPNPIFGEEYKELDIELSDGDRLIANYYPGKTDRIAYLFHGLGGSRFSDYLLATSKLLHAQGYHCLCVSLRGSDPVGGFARKPWHSGRSADLSDIIDYGRKRFSGFKHLAIGFSSSANALLCLMGGKDGESLPDAAIAVNSPLDLEKCSLRLTRMENKAYDLRFVINLSNIVRSRFPAEKDFLKTPSMFMTLRKFDEEFTAPVCGFKNRDEFYFESSSIHYLSGIQKPTLIIHAKDDPLIEFSDYENIVNPNIVMEIQNTGGHMGYLTKHKLPTNNYFWMYYALSEYTIF